jgi:hypothetical protein
MTVNLGRGRTVVLKLLPCIVERIGSLLWCQTHKRWFHECDQ